MYKQAGSVNAIQSLAIQVAKEEALEKQAVGARSLRLAKALLSGTAGAVVPTARKGKIANRLAKQLAKHSPTSNAALSKYDLNFMSKLKNGPAGNMPGGAFPGATMPSAVAENIDTRSMLRMFTEEASKPGLKANASRAIYPGNFLSGQGNSPWKYTFNRALKSIDNTAVRSAPGRANNALGRGVKKMTDLGQPELRTPVAKPSGSSTGILSSLKSSLGSALGFGKKSEDLFHELGTLAANKHQQ